MTVDSIVAVFSADGKADDYLKEICRTSELREYKERIRAKQKQFHCL